MSREGLPDAAYAAALAALPEMTPAQLSRLLREGSGLEVHEAVAGGDPSLIDTLAVLGRHRHGGGPPRDGQSAGAAGDEIPLRRGVGSQAVPLFGSASEMERRRAGIIARLSAWRAELAMRPVAEVWAALVDRGINVVRRGEPGYPRRLLRADFPPELLYVKGTVAPVEAPAVAIVGTRRATHYGMEIAGEMGQGLAERGITVVSGLARGIDAAAHTGFLSARERTAGAVAVVGGGVDVVYPRENRRLWDAVVDSGAVVSEAPPGAPPEGWRFPLRNRIIAALSQVVVIVESSRQGGAMHTVQAADSIGIPVLAVPGSVRSPQSEGTNAIIGEGGASLATDVYDILTALSLVNLEEGTTLSFSPQRPAGGERPSRSSRLDSSKGPTRLTRGPSSGKGSEPGLDAQLRAGSRPWGPTPSRSMTDAEPARRRLLEACTVDERAVYEALEHTPTAFDVICARTHFGVGTVALALDHLEELGLVRSIGPSWQRA